MALHEVCSEVQEKETQEIWFPRNHPWKQASSPQVEFVCKATQSYMAQSVFLLTTIST